MTGQELFHALSFVDERYIAEAESASFRKIPWMKVLSVAACLCIVLAGAFALSNMGMKSTAPEAAARPHHTHRTHTAKSQRKQKSHESQNATHSPPKT